MDNLGRHRRPPARPRPGRPGRHPDRHRPVRHPRPARRPGHRLCHPPRTPGRTAATPTTAAAGAAGPNRAGGRAMVGVSAFQFGNVAATLLILRRASCWPWSWPGPGDTARPRWSAAPTTSPPRWPASPPAASATAAAPSWSWPWAWGCSGWPISGSPPARPASSPGGWWPPRGGDWLCGDGSARCVVAALAPLELRGSAFGLLAWREFGNLAASAIAGLLWTLASPRVAFASSELGDDPRPRRLSLGPSDGLWTRQLRTK